MLDAAGEDVDPRGDNAGEVLEEVVGCAEFKVSLDRETPCKPFRAVAPHPRWARVRSVHVCWATVSDLVHAYASVRIREETIPHEPQVVEADRGDVGGPPAVSFGSLEEFPEAAEEMVDKWDYHGHVCESSDGGVEVLRRRHLVIDHF